MSIFDKYFKDEVKVKAMIVFMITKILKELKSREIII